MTMSLKKKTQKLHLKRGDTVQVRAGNEKGKQGKITHISPRKHKAIVEGLNMVTRHIKPTKQNQEGGRKQKEAPIHISNLMVIDPTTNTPSPIGRRKNAEGKLQRYAKKTNNLL